MVCCCTANTAVKVTEKTVQSVVPGAGLQNLTLVTIEWVAFCRPYSEPLVALWAIGIVGLWKTENIHLDILEHNILVLEGTFLPVFTRIPL